MTDVYRRLAEEAGARFYKGSDSDRWTAQDSDGITIVTGAMSIAEAARLYCEDKGLTSPDEILNRIVATYRPYHVLEEFWQGFRACRRDSVVRCNPHRDGESMQARAWNRGADVAMKYQQALAHKATVPDEVEPGWVVRLLRTGRC
jgi:hypothetical protein